MVLILAISIAWKGLQSSRAPKSALTRISEGSSDVKLTKYKYGLKSKYAHSASALSWQPFKRGVIRDSSAEVLTSRILTPTNSVGLDDEYRNKEYVSVKSQGRH